ncbi:serine/threonine-protein kinase-like protein [Teratosphaeria destructans]|uniref:Serine/threonine-protein kinase-like protein n=1 Tax=Teratosphaeria destructans TaxID=418781 RepID=A0A9W7SM79_9PEZI|nr:serine/threonine-protein kinase-like protein [Teratosphaeria destructans]
MEDGELSRVTVRDLRPLYEAFSEEDDEHGNPIFLYSSFGYITKDFVAYFGQSAMRKLQLTPKDIRESLELLPDDDVYPEAPPNITIAPTPMHDGLYVKGPMLNTAFQGTGLLPKLTLREVEVLETLKQNPHPNIVRYMGCLVERGLVVGLVFDRLSKTLEERLKEHDRDFSIDAYMNSITSVVEHLHSLGLAHNDINPNNIMVDEVDTIFVIDYGSCQPFGFELITAGTRGWIDEDFTVSARHHDLLALKKIRNWLDLQRRK